MRKALGFALAFVSGTCFGCVLAWETSKGTIVREVEKQTASLFLAAEKAEVLFEEPFDTEAAVEYAAVVDTTNYQAEPAIPNTGIHRISESDFQHESSFEKVFVEIFMGDDLPVFVFDGTAVEDWFSVLGETIVLSGDETKDAETFYVRNHILRADYEVTWSQP